VQFDLVCVFSPLAKELPSYRGAESMNRSSLKPVAADSALGCAWGGSSLLANIVVADPTQSDYDDHGDGNGARACCTPTDARYEDWEVWRSLLTPSFRSVAIEN
jgi:hypothetical protein